MTVKRCAGFGTGLTIASYLVTALLSAAPSTTAGFVYVMTNAPSGNAIVQYARSAATLAEVGRTATGGLGGTGNGVGSLDPLGSQDSLVLSDAGSVLLAVNAGSNQVSALSAGAAGVRLLNVVSSGGTFPNSVALHRDLVYVVNAHGTPNISGFRLAPDGLHPIANSTVALPAGSAAVPHDIRFTPDGTRLLVSDEGSNSIDVFDVNGAGLVTAVHASISAGAGPFGMKFGRGGTLVNAEAGSGSVSSYTVTATGMLAPVSPAVSDGQQATCWISLTANGKFGFVSNTASGNLSSYAIAQDGTLNLEQAIAATAGDGAPIDSALSSDSAFLFADDSRLGRILIYAVHGSSLHPLRAVSGLPTTLQGIAAQ